MSKLYHKGGMESKLFSGNRGDNIIERFSLTMFEACFNSFYFDMELLIYPNGINSFEMLC